MLLLTSCADSMNMPAISYIELGVRHTHCLWSLLNASDAMLPPKSRWPAGVSLPLGLNSRSTGSEKEPHEVSHLFVKFC